MLGKLIDKYLPPKPSEEEIRDALSLDKWRTSDTVLRVINERRSKTDVQPLLCSEELQGRNFLITMLADNARFEITFVLEGMAIEGSIETKSAKELSLMELAEMEDPKVNSPLKLGERLRIRGDMPVPVYRRTREK